MNESPLANAIAMHVAVTLRFLERDRDRRNAPETGHFRLESAPPILRTRAASAHALGRVGAVSVRRRSRACGVAGSEPPATLCLA